MSIIQTRKFRIGLVVLLTILTAIYVSFYYVQKRRSSMQIQSPRSMTPYPKEGMVWNPTDGRIANGGKRGVDDLGRIFRYMNIYKDRRGKYPTHILSILTDDPKAYGFDSTQELYDSFLNPDNKYSDSLARTKQQIVNYWINDKRPDGTSFDAPKPSGTRDALAYVDTYVRKNRKNWPEKSTMMPEGFYLVLWEDGTVEKVPTKQVLYTPRDNGEYGLGFPGQAGLPPGTKTFEDFYKGAVYARP